MKKWIGLLALLMLALVCATALGETNTQVKHYLMLGEDGYAEHVTDDARTDTIVLVSLDTKYNRVILTSILRDSKINNPRGNETKINLLYKNHGFSGIISCLERELDIQIEGAILVNFENVKPVIDALGGVDIDVHDNEIDHLNNYQRSMFVENENDALNENIVKVTHSGMQTLSGLQATAYCRIRYVGDDFGRAERQRKVLMACMDKAKTMSPTTLVSILNKVMENVYTNLDVTEMASILSDVANYQIVAQDGVPFEDSRTTGTIGKKGSCVIPLDLETNVVKLHELLFDVTEYEPSDQVKQYSQKVQADTSQYMKK